MFDEGEIETQKEGVKMSDGINYDKDIK